jgi:hypothetical protein
MKYELGVYIPEDDILHYHCRENLKSYNFPVHFAKSYSAFYQLNETVKFQSLFPLGRLFCGSRGFV